MNKLKELLAAGPAFEYFILDEIKWIEGRERMNGEVVIVVPAKAEGEVPLLVNYSFDKNTNYCRVAHCDGSRHWTPVATADDDAHWPRVLIQQLNIPESDRNRVLDAIGDWIAGTRQYMTFVRTSRHAMRNCLDDVSGGSYREADPSDSVAEWSIKGITSATTAEYWFTIIPGEADRLVMLSHREPVDLSFFENSVDWAVFELDSGSVPGVGNTTFEIKGRVSLTLLGTGVWTRMRTLFISYLEIYDHAEGFETAADILTLLKSVIMISGRDTGE